MVRGELFDSYFPSSVTDQILLWILVDRSGLKLRSSSFKTMSLRIPRPVMTAQLNQKAAVMIKWSVGLNDAPEVL